LRAFLRLQDWPEKLPGFGRAVARHFDLHVFMQIGIDVGNQRGNLAQDGERNLLILEQALRHGKLDRIIGRENNYRVKSGVEGVGWLRRRRSRQQGNLTVGALGKTVAIFYAALRAIHVDLRPNCTAGAAVTKSQSVPRYNDLT